MINKLTSVIHYIKKFLIALMIALVFLCLDFYVHFRSVKQNIIDSVERDVIQYATETDDFLSESIDIVNVTADSIEDMMDKGASLREIESYLVIQSNAFSDVSDKNLVGVYGVFDGEYLDGMAGKPEDDFAPYEYKWYKDAVEADGEIVLGSPYVDEYTGSTIITISKLLKDGKSVVSIDVGFDTIQKITENSVPDGKRNYALVLDSDGMVVAHSLVSNNGKSYKNGDEVFWDSVADTLFSTDDNYFEVQYDSIRYAVFNRQIGNEWHVLFVMNEDSLYRSLIIIYIVLSIVIVVILGSAIVFLMQLYKRSLERDNLNTQLKAISSIYAFAYMIDLNWDTYEEIISNEVMRALLVDEQKHAMDTLKLIMNMYIDESSKRNVKSFLDFATLDERLSDMVTVTQEFLTSNNTWYRARFISIDRNDDGTLRRVMLAVEVIDEEKRQRDRLQILSETDRMTGILNRGGGEAKIREMLDGGRSGMFCLMDADKFKSINDNYGHGVGDKVLIEIANCLKKSFRDNDIVMRLGGDEFAAYAPTVLNEKTGQQIIDRFFYNIDNINIPELEDRKICISMGVVFYKPDDELTFDELYKKADQGTYISKKHEGNYVSYYNEEN